MRACLNEQSIFNLQDEFNCVENCAIKIILLNADLISNWLIQAENDFCKNTSFSFSAIPTKYESKTTEPDSLDARALTTGELETQTRYKKTCFQSFCMGLAPTEYE